MRPFLTSRRKLVDLLVLMVLAGVVWFFSGYETTFLFSFGFLWNWVASQDLTQYMEGRSYRYTMLRFVLNLQTLILSPPFVRKLPETVKLFIRSLPAGLFWSVIIYLQDSDLPMWATFLGSFVFEVSQWEILFRKKEVSQ